MIFVVRECYKKGNCMKLMGICLKDMKAVNQQVIYGFSFLNLNTMTVYLE